MDVKSTSALVKEIINKNDPLNLLKQGAPSDEYEAEIESITAAASKCKTVKELQEAIHGIFKDNFGEETAGNINLYFDIAKDIFKKAK